MYMQRDRWIDGQIVILTVVPKAHKKAYLGIFGALGLLNPSASTPSFGLHTLGTAPRQSRPVNNFVTAATRVMTSGTSVFQLPPFL